MKTEVFVRDSQKGFTLQLGAEVVDEWETGCMIRSEGRLLQPQGTRFYVAEGDSVVAVKLTSPDQKHPPFDYPAEKDRSDIRPMPTF
jgi:hypothetical protein